MNRVRLPGNLKTKKIILFILIFICIFILIKTSINNKSISFNDEINLETKIGNK